MDVEEATCAVCLEDLEAGKHVTTPCNHHFHPLCLHRFMAERTYVCPMCRASLKEWRRTLGTACAPTVKTQFREVSLLVRPRDAWRTARFSDFRDAIRFQVQTTLREDVDLLDSSLSALLLLPDPWLVLRDVRAQIAEMRADDAMEEGLVPVIVEMSKSKGNELRTALNNLGAKVLSEDVRLDVASARAGVSNQFWNAQAMVRTATTRHDLQDAVACWNALDRTPAWRTMPSWSVWWGGLRFRKVRNQVLVAPELILTTSAGR